jgi:hypothetical protein
MAVRQRTTDEASGRVLGLLSGLGVAFVPWVAACVLSTVGEMVGGEAWSPETTFPWLALGAFVAMLGWLAYGGARIPGFRRGALLGAALALAGVSFVVALALLLRP